MDQPGDLAWNLLVELRKEILESQRIRAQIIGFKITFVSAGIGVIIANHTTVPLSLIAVPAVAAIFFDFLITSYSRSNKRIGFYCRAYVEPKLRQVAQWPSSEPLWEEYMAQPGVRGERAFVGNVGLTALVVISAAAVLLVSVELWWSVPASLFMGVLLSTDMYAYRSAASRFDDRTPVGESKRTADA